MSKYLEALKALDFIEEQSYKPEHKQKGISDEVEKIREALQMAHDGKTYNPETHILIAKDDVPKSCIIFENGVPKLKTLDKNYLNIQIVADKMEV